MACHVLCASVNFDTGNDSLIGNGFNKGSAIFLMLADRLVIKDRATNGLPQTGRGDNQLPVGAPRLFGLGNPQLGKSFVAGWITLIHCQQAFIASD